MNKNYPKIYQEDIKVLGRVVSIASENKVAAAEQVFDEKFNYSDLTRYALDATASTTEGLDQYTINRLFGKKLYALDRANLVPDTNGYIGGNDENSGLKVNYLIVKYGATFNGDVTINGDLDVSNNIKTKNLEVTEEAKIKKLILNNVNVGDFIDRVNKIIAGEDKDNALWRYILDLEGRIETLESCCEEMHNQPQGGITLTVNPTSLNMNVGDTKEITVTSEPALAGSPTATSSDPSVASVTVSGGKVIVTGKKAGTATITIEWGGATKTVQVTVVDPTPVEDVYEISLSPKTANVDVTNSSTYPVTITATRTKNGTATTEGSIDWRSTNPAIATVSNGVVSPVEGGPNGTVTITAIWNGVSDTCTVTVSGHEVPEPTKYTLQYLVSWPDNPGQTEVWTSQEYYANDTITLPTEPTFAGYTFAGWDGLPSDMKMPSDNLTVEAKWTENGGDDDISVIVRPESIELNPNDGYLLEVEVVALSIDGINLDFWSEDESIATVEHNGFFRVKDNALDGATVKIYAGIRGNHDINDYCLVTVAGGGGSGEEADGPIDIWAFGDNAYTTGFDKPDSSSASPTRMNDTDNASWHEQIDGKGSVTVYFYPVEGYEITGASVELDERSSTIHNNETVSSQFAQAGTVNGTPYYSVTFDAVYNDFDPNDSDAHHNMHIRITTAGDGGDKTYGMQWIPTSYTVNEGETVECYLHNINTTLFPAPADNIEFSIVKTDMSDEISDVATVENQGNNTAVALVTGVKAGYALVKAHDPEGRCDDAYCNLTVYAAGGGTDIPERDVVLTYTADNDEAGVVYRNHDAQEWRPIDSGHLVQQHFKILEGDGSAGSVIWLKANDGYEITGVTSTWNGDAPLTQDSTWTEIAESDREYGEWGQVYTQGIMSDGHIQINTRKIENPNTGNTFTIKTNTETDGSMAIFYNKNKVAVTSKPISNGEAVYTNPDMNNFPDGVAYGDITTSDGSNDNRVLWPDIAGPMELGGYVTVDRNS